MSAFQLPAKCLVSETVVQAANNSTDQSVRCAGWSAQLLVFLVSEAVQRNKVWHTAALVIKLFCKFTDHRVFYLSITDHRQYLCHKSQTFFQPFYKSQKAQSQVTEIPLAAPSPPTPPVITQYFPPNYQIIIIQSTDTRQWFTQDNPIKRLFNIIGSYLRMSNSPINMKISSFEKKNTETSMYYLWFTIANLP